MAATTHRLTLASRTSANLPFSHSLLPPRPARVCVTRAGDSKDGPATPDIVQEDRLEQLEASVRGKKAQAAAQRRTIPIRGVNQPNQKEESNSRMAEWKEGQLFPEGWDNMPLGQKVTELYLGRRGVLYWANQSAWYSVFIVAFAWVFFRFVGPNLGLYQLAGDLPR